MDDANELSAIEIAALISASLNSTLSPSDQARLENWLAQSHSNPRLYAQLTDEITRDNLVATMGKFDATSAYERFNIRIADKAHDSLVKRLSLKKVALIAATIIGFIIAPLWFINRNLVNDWLYPASYASLHVQYGKRQMLQLADGSKIWVNAGTTLKYPTRFGSQTREVFLSDGEAYFEVAHDRSKPFIIHANGLSVQVLGTSFDIESYLADQDTKVTVNSGKVGVLTKNKQPATFVLPGERVIVNHQSLSIRKIKVDTADVGGWRNNLLIFENQPLGEVLQKLERKYSVHFQVVHKDMLDRKVNMRLNGEQIEDVLSVLSFANHFTYQIVDEQLIIIK